MLGVLIIVGATLCQKQRPPSCMMPEYVELTGKGVEGRLRPRAFTGWRAHAQSVSKNKLGIESTMIPTLGAQVIDLDA